MTIAEAAPRRSPNDSRPAPQAVWRKWRQARSATLVIQSRPISQTKTGALASRAAGTAGRAAGTAGVQMHWAPCGQSAFQLLSSLHFDVVIADPELLSRTPAGQAALKLLQGKVAEGLKLVWICAANN